MILNYGFIVKAESFDWKIKKVAWTDVDEKDYSEFVAKIGDAVKKRQCNSFQSCLNHPNNPYRGSDSSQLKFFADCAKLAYVMRTYFAWKKGLPFSFSSDMELRNPGSHNHHLDHCRWCVLRQFSH